MNVLASNCLLPIFVLVLFQRTASEFNNAVIRMDCRNSVYFDGNQKGFALRGYIEETKTTRTMIECLAHCSSMDVCKSINFFNGKKMDNCDLNNVKASQEHPLEEVEMSVYMETKTTHHDLLSSVCSSEPCQNGAICKTCDPGTSYECVCPTEYGGTTCELELCDSTLKYASFNGSAERWVEPGTTGIYTCNPGYSYANNTDGVLPRVCVKHTMIPAGPTCYASCRSPSTPMNGKFTVNDPEMKHGSEASFSCDPKYIMFGSATTRCFDGSWETASPECKAPCVSPSAPLHGNFRVNDPDMKHNSEASFYCDSMYTLVGSSTSRCSDGSWEEDSPKCKAPCENPIAPTNGSFTVDDIHLKHNTKASFSCAPKYTITGSSISQCSDGSWDTDFPECRAPCTVPDAPLNGYITETDPDMKHGTVVTFMCNSTSTLQGTQTITCFDGVWGNYDIPQCQPS
ncbi:C4b-binding protein alpha chain-like isoform X2 [Anneissia japonica]|uniref:C4b-binding protein alpha chain-like isoform X2 n=1 Tax=Anneissia japonica TaxID=1529436 RepID=UPI001425553E|nr:C4b-binding protein alpha chain-like isoform X2 [Anneissia japonica]